MWQWESGVRKGGGRGRAWKQLVWVQECCCHHPCSMKPFSFVHDALEWNCQASLLLPAAPGSA